MLYKLLLILIISQLIPNTCLYASDREKEMAHSLALLMGAPNTPTKSIATKVLSGGLAPIAEAQQEHELMRIREREAEEKKKNDMRKALFESQIKRQEDAERHEQERSAFAREREDALARERELIRKKEEERVDLVSHQEQEKAAIIQSFKELLAREQEAAVNSNKILDYLRQELQRQETKALEAQRVLQEREEHFQRLLSSASTQLSVGEVQQIAQLKQALEAERAKRVEESDAELRQKLAEVEQEKNELLNALVTLQGGQAITFSKETCYVSYDGSYIHDSQLKEPDSSLDVQLQQKLVSIVSGVASLLKEVSGDSKLKPVQRMLTKQQLNRLKEGAEDFEATTFSRIFDEVCAQVPSLDNSDVFKNIRSTMQWLQENKQHLVRVGEHRVYKDRQLAARRLVLSKTQEMQDFYEDYLDRVVADMSIWLSPEATDEESVKTTKLAFRLKLLTCSIPTLRNYICGPIAIYGTMDTFLTQTFIRLGLGKGYDDFKKVLESYSHIFHGLGEHAKLIEELVNYEFFQKRFQTSKAGLNGLDLSLIKDPVVKSVMEEMKQHDVLKYNESKTTLFATNLSTALQLHMTRKSISPEESLIAPIIGKALISYSQLDSFGKNLKAANPKIVDFHTH